MIEVESFLINIDEVDAVSPVYHKYIHSNKTKVFFKVYLKSGCILNISDYDDLEYIKTQRSKLCEKLKQR